MSDALKSLGADGRSRIVMMPTPLSEKIRCSRAEDAPTQAEHARRVRSLQEALERTAELQAAERLDLVARVLEWLGSGHPEPQPLLALCAEVTESAEDLLAAPVRRGTAGPLPDRSDAERPRTSTGLLELMDDGPEGLQTRHSKFLGQILVELGTLRPEVVAEALQRQRGSGLRLGEVLVEMGACTWEQVERAAEVQQRLLRTVSFTSA